MTVTIRHGNLGAASTQIAGYVRMPSPLGEGILAPAWQLTEGGEKGATAISGLNVEDPSAAQTLTGLKEVHCEDSSCTEPTIFAGFWAGRDIGRADALRTGSERQWDAETTDLNVLLSDYIIDSGSRPAETDAARINWLLGSGYLPIGDAGFIDRSSPCSLPAADYTGRNALDVLAEASNLSGANYCVRWEQIASFWDPAGPWWPGFHTTYVPWSGTAQFPVPTSLDALGGSCFEATYYPASPVYSSAASWSGSNNMFTTWTPNANTGTNFGFTAPSVAGPNPGPQSLSARWIWDLASAGLPLIATVGLVNWQRGTNNDGVFAIQVSDDGTNWTTLFDQAAITAANINGGINPTSILSVPFASANHRYWSLTLAMSSTDTWGGYATGFLLWVGTATGPGPALVYHQPSWSGDQSPLTISNVRTNWNGTTCLGPRGGDKLTRDPQRVYSGCWFEYSGGHVYVTNGTTLANFRHRDVRSSDMSCTTAAAATALATAYLARCNTEEDRFTCNIDNVPAAYVNLVRPAQRISCKFSHIPGYTGGAYLSIMQRMVSPAAQGIYNMQLILSNPVLTSFHPSKYLAPSLWTDNTRLVISPTSSPGSAVPGQPTTLTHIAYGDGVTTTWTLASGYIPGSLRVWVDGQEIAFASITETSPTAGTFALDFAPAGASGSASAQDISAFWQVG